MFPRTEERRGTSSVAFRQGGRKDPRGAMCDVRCADSPMGSENMDWSHARNKIKSRPKTRVSCVRLLFCYGVVGRTHRLDRQPTVRRSMRRICSRGDAMLTLFSRHRAGPRSFATFLGRVLSRSDQPAPTVGGNTSRTGITIHRKYGAACVTKTPK